MAGSENVVVVSELGDRSDAELSSLLASKREELHATKFKHALGQLAQTHELRRLKRDVARCACHMMATNRASWVRTEGRKRSPINCRQCRATA